MNPTHVCPKCQSALPANAPEGLCPQCLLKAAAGAPPAGDIIDIGDATAVAKCFPQYEILELIGRGGMGVVYKARQLQLDRIVALKILPPVEALSPDFVARFTREARSLAKLTHANIVAIYDFGESGGLYYFSMEYVDGVNLRALLAEGKVAPVQALAIVPLVCDALAYAHEEGIVHRDIKPENILIDKKGRVKIADFGLAKLLHRESLDLTLTLTGVSLGTVRYMAPEQMDKPETVDHRADIYSLGVVIYEMLTGEIPMGRFAPPSATAGVDARLDEIVLHTLEREPALRYQHVTEVKTDLEGIHGLIEKLPPALRAQFGFDYRSAMTLFGLPLLHVATGVDPATGKQRVAKGIIAIGSRARGVFACGGIAQGLIAFGGIAIGGLAMGGLSIGIVSMGGLALALFFAYGGICAAPYAIGGVCAGYLAGGGVAFGKHTASGLGSDAIGRAFFGAWYARVMFSFFILFLLALIGQFAGIWIAKRALAAGPAPTSKPRGDDAESALPVRNPAIGLFITGIFYWAMIPLCFFLLMRGEWQPRIATNFLLSFGIVPLVVGTVMILGGIRMNRLESRGLALVASLLPLVVLGLRLLGMAAAGTLAIGPADIIGAPMGLWALAVLTRHDVKAAFAARARGDAILPSPGIPRSAAIFPLVAGIALTVAAAIFSHPQQPIFYTFYGVTDFTKGPDGPVLSEAFIKKAGFTSAQVAELNKIISAHYREFVSIERRHTEVSTDARGHVHVKIAPFPDESLALAQRMAAELRGLLGRQVMPQEPKQANELRSLGLFRHCGVAEVAVELWKDGVEYHYEEKHGAHSIPGGTSGGASRGASGKNWREVFPEEYQVYWTEQ